MEILCDASDRMIPNNEVTQETLAILCTNMQFPTQIETQLKEQLREIYTLKQEDEEEVIRKYRIALQDSYSNESFILAHQFLFTILWSKEHSQKNKGKTSKDLLNILVKKYIMENTISH